MGAGIDEGANLHVLPAHHDQGHAAEILGEVVAWLRHAAVVANAVPELEEDAFALAIVEALGGVAPGR
jgi:hypothetical protein